MRDSKIFLLATHPPVAKSCLELLDRVPEPA